VEKLIYSLWPQSGRSIDEFRDELLGQLCPLLVQLHGLHGVRLAVADSAVAPAVKRRMESHPPLPAAALSLWVDNAGAAATWEPLVDRYVERKGAYLVVEAEPLPSRERHPSLPGERVHGMCHVVFMRKPVQLEREQWLSIWKDSHTAVAIDTQSTFGYRQNVVARVLGAGTLAFDAIVEENFPPEAMDSDHAFYNTGGDEGLLQQRMTAMIESCARFIDFGHIDVIPMSEYVVADVVRP